MSHAMFETSVPLRAAGLAVLLAAPMYIPGVVSFGPVFDGLQGYVAAGGGALAGLIIGLVASRRLWSVTSTVAVITLTYLLLGGPLALSATTIAGVIPTLDTLTRLVPLSVQAWRDLLTVTPPADQFVGPAVVPFLSGLVLAALGGFAASRRKQVVLALVPPLLLLTIGILWGLDRAPFGAVLGLVYGTSALTFAAWHHHRNHHRVTDEILGNAAPAGRRMGQLARGTAVLVAGATAALIASPVLTAGADRHVLRDDVTPPFQLRDYASPLAQYRYLELDLAKVTLFTVAGLPADARLRLASLDAYDGVVYNVAADSAGFLRVGEQFAWREPSGGLAQLQINVQKYAGVWLPGGGNAQSLTFGGPRGEAMKDGLYYNAWGGTLLTTAGIGEGDSYSVDLRFPVSERTAAETASLADSTSPQTARAPEVVGKVALELVGDAATPFEQLERLEKKLHETGYYSNGADGRSRAGHTAERIASMLTAPTLVGDDEQYAVAMALMAGQLGIPARVVLGFYPEENVIAPSPLAVTGAMAHVWVEVRFDDVGWVVFDPTPDRDRVPQTEVPKPKPQPKPQVITLPDPPPNQAADPLDDPGDTREQVDEDGLSTLLAILRVVAAVLGGAAVIAGPFALIMGLKHARRRRRRMNPDLPARYSGGWAEVEDAALDLGASLPPAATRRETSLKLADVHPSSGLHELACEVDAAIFGGESLTDQGAVAVWSGVDAARNSMRGGVGRWRRLRATFSLRSLLAHRHASLTKSPRVSPRFVKKATP